MRLHRALLAVAALVAVAGPFSKFVQADDSIFDDLMLSDLVESDDSVLFNLDDGNKRDDAADADWIRYLAEERRMLMDMENANKTSASKFLRTVYACKVCGDFNSTDSSGSAFEDFAAATSGDAENKCKMAVANLLCGPASLIDSYNGRFSLVPMKESDCRNAIMGVDLVSYTMPSNSLAYLIGDILQETCDVLPWAPLPGSDKTVMDASYMDALQTRYCVQCMDSNGEIMYMNDGSLSKQCRVSIANFACDSAVTIPGFTKPDNCYASVAGSNAAIGSNNLYNVTLSACAATNVNYMTYTESQVACDTCADSLYASPANYASSNLGACKSSISGLLCDPPMGGSGDSSESYPFIYGLSLSNANTWNTVGTCKADITGNGIFSDASSADAAAVTAVTSATCDLVKAASTGGASSLTCAACTSPTLSAKCESTAVDVLCGTGGNKVRGTGYLPPYFDSLFNQAADGDACVAAVSATVGNIQASVAAVAASGYCGQTTLAGVCSAYFPSDSASAGPYNLHVVGQFICHDPALRAAAAAAAGTTPASNDGACMSGIFNPTSGATDPKYTNVYACACSLGAIPTCANTATSISSACIAVRGAGYLACPTGDLDGSNNDPPNLSSALGPVNQRPGLNFTVVFPLAFSAYTTQAGLAVHKPALPTQLLVFICQVNVRTYNLFTKLTGKEAYATLPQRRCTIGTPVQAANGNTAIPVSIEFNAYDFYVKRTGRKNVTELAANLQTYNNYAQQAANDFGTFLQDPANLAGIYNKRRGWLSVGGDYVNLGNGFSFDTESIRGLEFIYNNTAYFPLFVQGGADSTSRRRLLVTLGEADFTAGLPAGAATTFSSSFSSIPAPTGSIAAFNSTPSVVGVTTISGGSIKKSKNHHKRDVALGVGIGIGLGGGLLAIGGIAYAVSKKKKGGPAGRQQQVAQPDNVQVVTQQPATI